LKILTEDLDMRKMCAKMVSKNRRTKKSKEESKFVKIKESILKERHFDDTDDIRNMTAVLKTTKSVPKLF